MLNILSAAYRSTANIFVRYPSASSGSLVFTLAFALIAGNALYAQKSNHPAPLWQTYEIREHQRFHQPSSINEHAKRVSKSVLTQQVSLNNIPVPTARPKYVTNEKADSILIRDIQSELALLGFYKGNVDGIFGSGTQAAILNFQRNTGILPNGEVNYRLLTNLKSATSLIKQRSHEQLAPKVTTYKKPKMIIFDVAFVSKIQSGLKHQFGETDIVIDGVMGEQTRAALRNFQKRFKLKVTGEPDDATLSKLIAMGIIQTI